MYPLKKYHISGRDTLCPQESSYYSWYVKQRVKNVLQVLNFHSNDFSLANEALSIQK